MIKRIAASFCVKKLAATYKAHYRTNKTVCFTDINFPV